MTESHPHSPSPPCPSSPPEVPGYGLLRCIGRGSYGEVWLARASAGPDPGSFLAVKVVYRTTFDHDRPFERELSGIEKFEPISRGHPSQLAILQVGVNRPLGYFYYVMELADDAAVAPEGAGPTAGSPRPRGAGLSATRAAEYVPHTLKQELQRQGRLPLEQCLKIGLGLATALEHLHGHGLIHRDIKPSNVVFVDGVPKLADVGLVTDAGATISYVGTEGFLPPEGPGTPQADLYSLGKVLYEMATGRDRLDFPELPTLGGQGPARAELLELNLVLLKACQNDPRRRYESARQLLEDLQLLQSGGSLRRVRARRERLARLKAALAVVAALCLLSWLALLLLRLEQSRRETAVGQEAGRRVHESGRQDSQQLAELAAANGERARLEGDPAGALLWLARAFAGEPSDPAGPTPRQLSLQSRLRETFAACPLPRSLLPTAGNALAPSWSGDAQRVLSGTPENGAQLWDVGRGGPVGVAFAGAGSPLRWLALAPSGTTALLQRETGPAEYWVQAGTAPASLPLEPSLALSRVRFSPNGRQFLGVAQGTNLLVWGTSGRLVRFAFPHVAAVRETAFSPDSQWLASVDEQGMIRGWSLANGEPTPPGPSRLQQPAAGLLFHPDNRRVAVWGGSELFLHDLRGGLPTALHVTHEGRLRSACFSPDGTWLLTAGEDQTARLWNNRGGQAALGVWRHPGPVQEVAFHPDGQSIATASGNQVRWLPLPGAGTLETPRAVVLEARVNGLRFSPAGDQLYCASEAGAIRGMAQEEFRPMPHPSATPLTGTAADWTAWGELLSGRELTRRGEAMPLPAEKLDRLARLLGERLAELNPAPSLPAWHETEAERAEAAGAWFAAGFHWDQAAGLQPGNRKPRERSALALERLRQAEATAGRPAALVERIPSRPAEATAAQLDLSAFYNASLTKSWLPAPAGSAANDLAELPRGLQRFGGHLFDVRGLIQLSGAALENVGGRFPRAVEGLPVKQRCRKLQFLQGAAWSALSGTQIGSYRVRYEDGSTREIPLRFGLNLREWWSPPTATPLTTGAAVAWEGGNAASRAVGMKLRLYQMTWINPRPDQAILSLDFSSTQEFPAPFLIAVTAE